MGAACISDTPEARKTERMEAAPQTSRGSYRSLAARSLAIVLLVAFAALLALPPFRRRHRPVICGHTEAVRDAIVGEISGVSNCADVTDTHLAAITGTLDLSFGSITTLAAGDFAGLTALDQLLLYNNSLSTLPVKVFDDLTALTLLWLGSNSLTSLPTTCSTI